MTAPVELPDLRHHLSEIEAEVALLRRSGEFERLSHDEGDPQMAHWLRTLAANLPEES